MKIHAPTDNDIYAVLSELDQDDDSQVSKEEFEFLIIRVLEKMAEIFVVTNVPLLTVAFGQFEVIH